MFEKTSIFFFLAIVLFICVTKATACAVCRIEVKNGIYNQEFFSNLFLVLAPVLIITAIGFSVYFSQRLSGFLKGESDGK